MYALICMGSLGKGDTSVTKCQHWHKLKSDNFHKDSHVSIMLAHFCKQLQNVTNQNIQFMVQKLVLFLWLCQSLQNVKLIDHCVQRVKTHFLGCCHGYSYTKPHKHVYMKIKIDFTIKKCKFSNNYICDVFFFKPPGHMKKNLYIWKVLKTVTLFRHLRIQY